MPMPTKKYLVACLEVLMSDLVVFDSSLFITIYYIIWTTLKFFDIIYAFKNG